MHIIEEKIEFRDGWDDNRVVSRFFLNQKSEQCTIALMVAGGAWEVSCVICCSRIIAHHYNL